MRSAPPEFAASELIQFAHRRAIKTDKEWSRELLEEAFALARHAQQPYKRLVGTGDLAGTIMFAKTVAELGMDRLSLQCEAITALLEVDPKRALALVREMDALELPVTRCEETGAPNIDAFYQMLVAVAKHCFDTKQQEKTEDIAFLESSLRQVNHPAQVAPAARVVRFYGTTPERLERLLNAFLTALDNVQQDDRSFTAGSNSPSAAELQTLGIFCTQYSKRGSEVFARIRRYLVEHLSGLRCADNVLTATGNPLPLPQAVSDFNQLIALDQYKIEEITEDEIKPNAVGGTAAKSTFWLTPKAARIRQRYSEVFLDLPKNGASTRPVSFQRPASDTPERRQAFQEFFDELKVWEPEENVSATDFYRHKLLLYAESFRWVPPSLLLNQVLRDYLELLSRSRAQLTNFPEWFAHFKSGLLSNYVFTDARGTLEAAKAAVEKSDDPFFQLFVRLSKPLADK